MADNDTWYVRCTNPRKDCGYAEALDRREARQRQRRHGCPNCNRGVAAGPLADADAALRERALSDDGPTAVKARIGD